MIISLEIVTIVLVLSLATMLFRQYDSLRKCGHSAWEAFIDLRRQVRTPAPPAPQAPSFVQLLIYGQSGDGSIFCGTSAVLRSAGKQVTLAMTTQLPFKSAYAVVLCDSSRVEVTGIFRGVDLAGVGDCPMAVLGTWPVGVTVRAIVALRVGDQT